MLKERNFSDDLACTYVCLQGDLLLIQKVGKKERCDRKEGS